MTSAPSISVVTPVYGRVLRLSELHERICAAVSRITDDFEIVMVNDASPDNAWEVIRGLSEMDPRVRGINLSRNFGQHAAITAGMEATSADWVVVMDCDLQDPPEEIEKLYGKAMEGYEIVFGKRIERQDSFGKKLFSRMFFAFIRYGCGLQHEPETANFGIFSRRVVEAAKANKQQTPFMQLLHNLGFRRGHVEVAHAAREHGKSSYTLVKKLSLAFDAVLSYSNRPLKMAIVAGFCISAISLLAVMWLVASYIFYDRPLAGWTSLIVSIYLIGGLSIANLGILGLYIGKVLDAAKHRPLYIVQETTPDRII